MSPVYYTSYIQGSTNVESVRLPDKISTFQTFVHNTNEAYPHHLNSPNISIRGLSGKYPSILNISRTGRLASQRRPQCASVNSHSPPWGQSVGSETPLTELMYCVTVVFAMTEREDRTIRLPILQLLCRFFFLAKHHITQVCQPLYSLDQASCDFWLFPKLKSPLYQMICG